MADNLERYVPEFDDDEQRERLSAFEREDLIHMLLRAYKEKRVLAKLLDEQHAKESRIRALLDERSALADAPGIPDISDLERMNGDENGG